MYEEQEHTRVGMRPQTDKQLKQKGFWFLFFLTYLFIYLFFCLALRPRPAEESDSSSSEVKTTTNLWAAAIWAVMRSDSCF